MALQFQDLSIPLTEGQDGSSDAALIQPPKLLTVQNGEFDDRGNIKMMDGFTALPITSMTGETAVTDTNATLRRLMTHKDEILLETYAGIFRQQVGGSFALAAGTNNRKRDRLRCMRAGVSSIVDAQGSQADDWSRDNAPGAGTYGMDAAQLGDYTCTVWCELYGTGAAPNAQVSWQIRHKTSDALVGRGRIRDSAGFVIEPRVVAFGGQFRIFAIGQGGFNRIGYLFIDPAATQAVSESLTLLPGSVGNDTEWFDIALSPTSYCVSAVDNVALQLGHLIFTQAAPTALAFSQYFAVNSTRHIGNAYMDSGGTGFGTGFVAFYSYAATLATARWSGITTAGAAIPAGAAALASGNLNRFFPMKDYTGSPTTWPVLVDASDASGTFITSVVYDTTTASPGTVAIGSTILRDHIVLGQPIAMGGISYEGTLSQGLWLPVQYQSLNTTENRNTFQVMDIARHLSRSMAGASSEPASFSVLRVFDAGNQEHWSGSTFFIGRVGTSVLVPGSGSLAAHVWCAKFTPNITDVTDLGQNPTHIQRNTLSYDDKVGSIEFADLTYMAGGTPLVYDGQDVFEEGFTYAPEIVSITVGAGVTPLSVGVYAIVFVYEWYDGQGNRWQSQPSKPSVFTTTVGNQTYTAVVRSLTASLKSGVQAIPYRTQADGTIFYRDSPLGEVAQTDADLANCELLYTGGVVTFAGTQSNNALPGVKNFTVHQNRLVAVGGEYGRGFFYSKERDDDFPAEFNRASGFGLVPEITGRIAAGSSLDDKLALFAENGLSVVFGQGPNRNWLQNGYNVPARIQAAEGIRFDSPFVGEVDDGVWYMTSNGPRLLTRGLATAKGADGLPLGIEPRASAQRPIGACNVLVHPTKAMVIFDDPASVRYIYDYQRNKWTTSNFGSGLSMVDARDTLYVIGSGTVASNPLKYEDTNNEDRNALTLGFGWISFAGLARFQRFTNLTVLCAQGNKTSLSDGFVVGLSVSVLSAPTVLAQVSSLAIDTTALPENTPWQGEFQMHRQTDTGYQLNLVITPAVAQPGGNFSITGLLARVGLKKGGPKLPASNRG
jgi:hypothetical protein